MTDSKKRPIDHEKLLREAIVTPGPNPAGQPPPPEPEELAPHFPDYELLGLVGRGGMGAVYRARHRKLERDVAIKVLPRELAADPEFGERFLREARALAALNHPHVLTVHDFGEVADIYYLVTEFVDGVNLRQLMELGELSPAEALRIAPQICEALQYAHEHGVVHRDIKPENILIDTRGHVMIADFGLAKLARPGDQVELTRSTEVFGTPHYMAPEQWRGSGAVDHRADIFSLGVVLYEMLTGHLPIGHFEPPSKRAGVPRGLDQVVQRTLARQPENRYQSARDVQSDVESQASLLGRAAPPAPVPQADGARLVKMPLVALGLVVLGVAGLFLAVFLSRYSYQASYRTHVAFERYRDHMNAVLNAVGTGQPLPKTGPALPVPGDATPVLSETASKILVFGGCTSIVILVLLLGFWSVRRVRAANGALRGMGLAVFVAWLVPLGLVNAALFAPIMSILAHDTRNIVTFFAILVIGAGDIAFLVWERRRQLALMAAGHAPRGRGLAFGAGVAVALLAVAASVAVALAMPADRDEIEIPAGVTAPSDLVGRPRSFVLARLGPPDAIECNANGQVWSYRGADDKPVRYALTLSGEHVLAGAPDAPVLKPNDMPDRGPYNGQPFQDLVRAIGNPVSRAQNIGYTMFTFADGLEVMVHDGIVAGFER